MIVIGLGNTGQEYDGTRHNLGFRVLDRVAEEHGSAWKADRTESMFVSTFGPHLLLKTQAYMNLTGQAFMKFWKYRRPDSKPQPSELMVVHDDLDLPLGEIRIQENRSAAGHRGVASLIEAFGSQEFHRLRIGIGNNRDVGQPAEQYVLQHFSADEEKVIAATIKKAAESLFSLLGPKT